MPPRPAQGLLDLPLLATLALAGCFVDYAPSVTSAPDETTGSSETGAPIVSTGGDTGTTGTTGTTGPELIDSQGDPPADSGDAGTTTGESTGGTSIADPTEKPPDPEQACIDATMELPCGECLCSECLDALSTCMADRGCTAIMLCAAEMGCLGFGCLEPCGAVIDEYGGPGSASAITALTLSLCAEDKCSQGC